MLLAHAFQYDFATCCQHYVTGDLHGQIALKLLKCIRLVSIRELLLASEYEEMIIVLQIAKV